MLIILEKMALSSLQQISELITKSKSILIIFQKDWSGDALAGSLALACALKKENETKKIEIVCDSFKANSNLNFLPLSSIKTNIENLQKMVISVSMTNAKVGEFYYDREGDKLNIYLTPQSGRFSANDVSTAALDFKYDLILTIGSPDLESLGSVYENHADFFYSIPKINIDCSNQNEHFGELNLIDLTASSSSEIIYDLIKQWNEKFIDEDIATFLLAGIILGTKNFKNRVSPKTLNISSLLVSMGARREQIIQNLYQSRFISTLKLWGRVLSRLNTDFDGQLAWAVVSANDFLETSTNPSELIDVVDELIVNAPKIRIITLIYETRDAGIERINCLIYSKNRDAMKLAKKFEPVGGNETAKFSLTNLSLVEAEKVITDELREKILAVEKN